MPPWIYIWILRIAGGEKFEKAKASDYRLWFGYFALFPFGLAAFPTIGKQILEQGSTVAIWIYSTVSIIVMLASLMCWAKFVPAKISIVVGVCGWAMAFWVVWHLI